MLLTIAGLHRSGSLQIEGSAYCSRVNAFAKSITRAESRTKVTPAEYGRAIRVVEGDPHSRRMPGRPGTTRGRIGALMLATVLLGLPLSTLLAADSPNGDHAAAWPTSWRAYTLKTGARISDVISDVGCGQGYCDVSSGPSGTLSSVYLATNGTTMFFRVRLLGDPRKPSAGGFASTAYVLQIAVNGVARVAVGLDGKSPQRDFVYVSNADGSAYTEIYATPFNNAGGEFSAGARGLPDGSGQYFVDWQVPLSRITQRSGGAVTGSTPVQLFFGTSQSANLSVVNKDFMIGNAVNFGSGSTITLVPQAPPAAPAATPRPPGASAPAAPSSPPGPVVPLPNTSAAGGPTPVDLALAVLLLTVSFVVLTRPRHASGSARDEQGP